MRVHDNGHSMSHGELWWVAWQPYSSKQPKVGLAIVEGHKPYQTLSLDGHYPTEIWVLQRATPPAVFKHPDGSLRNVAPDNATNALDVSTAFLS